MGLINQTPEEYYLGPDGLWNTNDENYGDYQFVNITDIINNFMIIYVGQDKIISKVKRTDVAYWAQKAIQEFSFDVLPSEKQIEVEVPPGLYTILPQDYVNYTKLSWTDHRGVERIVYRTDLSSNPSPYIQDEEYEYTFDSDSQIPLANDSTTLRRWNANNNSQAPMFGATGNWSWWLQNPDLMALYAYGGRYGIQPERAQANGTFYIDKIKGMIRWSSNLRSRLVVIKYISDGLGKDEDMNVHKFAVDAVMKFIAYSVLSTRANTQEYLVGRFKKEMYAAKRNAKIRLSELKSDLIVQVMRNQSKWIKS